MKNEDLKIINSKRKRFHQMLESCRKLKRLRHHSGFTLVELLLIILIIAVLAAIAVPLYLHYTETCKVREALGIIKGAITSQKLERMKTRSFYTTTGDAASTILSEKGIDVKESRYFSYETAGDADTFTLTATATAESGMTGTISYDSATKTWPCTGDIIEKMLPDSSE